MTDPRLIHATEQLRAHLRETARELGAYRGELEAQGIPKDEAGILLCRLEERLLGPILDDIADSRGRED